MNDMQVEALVRSIGEVATGLHAIASALHRLGNADAETPMGGMEALGAVHEKGYELLAAAISDLKSV